MYGSHSAITHYKPIINPACSALTRTGREKAPQLLRLLLPLLLLLWPTLHQSGSASTPSTSLWYLTNAAHSAQFSFCLSFSTTTALPKRLLLVLLRLLHPPLEVAQLRLLLLLWSRLIYWKVAGNIRFFVSIQMRRGRNYITDSFLFRFGNLF